MLSADDIAVGSHSGKLAAVLAAVACAATMLGGPASALAGIGETVAPTFQSTETIGQTGVPTSLFLLNADTPPEDAGTNTVAALTLVAACGTAVVDPSGGSVPTGDDDCPLADADPGVITLSPTATGVSGACTGLTFTLTVIDPATGLTQFNPSAPIVLTSPGTADSTCEIDFTSDVVKSPAHVSAPAGAHMYQTESIATVDETSSVTGLTSNDNHGTTPVSIDETSLGLTSTAVATATVGGSISDVAHVTPTGATTVAPGGTVTFRLFSNATCVGAPIFTSTAAVAGAGDYSSGPFAAPAAGVEDWVATYSGDANYLPVTSACGAMNESTTVSPTPVVTTPPTTPAATPVTTPATAPKVSPKGKKRTKKPKKKPRPEKPKPRPVVHHPPVAVHGPSPFTG
jgi:hypothetical protein